MKKLELTACRLQADVIARKRKQLERLRDLATAPPLAKIDGMPRSPNPEKSRVEFFAVEIQNLERELADDCAELERCAAILLQEIWQRVRSPVAAEILCRRYVSLSTFPSIIAAMNFSDAHVYQLHQRGVKDFNAGGDQAT